MSTQMRPRTERLPGEVDASYFDGRTEPAFSCEEQIRQKMERTYLPNWGKEQR